ncbi:carbohydrate ABC transporter permease [Gorillibacterium sp. sgz5001074]|uniref:carbohydrate ABC transporter permease n=1 Tax=Gorillibacterium sp. sgz5001074 TaxID=3446695 RepID=UPI003F6764C1
MRRDPGTLSFNAIGYTVIISFTLFCLIPFWLILAGSFSRETDVIAKGFQLFPVHLSLDAYRSVFTDPEQIYRAYGVTVGLTVTATLIGLWLTSMGGYVLSRQDFRFRGSLAFFIYFTTLFGGGLIPWYILMVKYLHLKDTYTVLVVVHLISAWNLILMKNFMRSIPDSLIESAKIDGAGDFKIYWRIMLPLSTPGLATIGLFIALGCWNEWFVANLFINDPNKYPLQYLLYKILSDASILQSTIAAQIMSVGMTPPTETLKMAIAVVATGPVILLYPFVQRYFVKGLTIGAVKG